MYAVPYLVLMWLHRAAIDARRRARTWHYLAWSVLAGVVAGALIGIGAMVATLLWVVGLWWMALPFAAIVIVPLVAPALTRHVLVPLGWPRLAYWGGVAARPGPDAEAYGLCCAAWAFARKPTARAEAWLAARRDARIPLGDAEVVATAFVAAGRGDAETARRLLRSVTLLVEDHPAVRDLAGEWLAVDAAERGAWRELHDDATRAHWPATPLGFLLEGIAARRLGAAGAPSRLELEARWLLAPHRRATRRLLDDAVPPATATHEAPAAGELAPAAPASDGDALPRAVAAHLELGLEGASAARLADAVRAWDAALADGATHAWLARRALELDAPLGAVDPADTAPGLDALVQRALGELAAAITDELARAADAARLGAPASHGRVGAALARRLRHGRLDALEQAFTRWAQRRHDGVARAAIDEWREFIALRGSHADAVTAGGDELRRLAFPHVFSTGSNMAAWLWNTRDEYALSHAISRWLLDEALAVGDAEAIELGHRNCRLTIPTRLGPVPGERE